MTVCYECGKHIKGQAHFTNPSKMHVQLGIDFPKAFHPKCYVNAEKRAAKTLKIDRVFQDYSS